MNTAVATAVAPSSDPGLRRAALLVAPCALIGAAGLFALGGSPAPAVAVVALTGVGAVLLRTKLSTLLLAVTFLVLVCDAPQDRPADGMWKSPLYWLGALLVNNLGKTFGVPGLTLSSLDAWVALVTGAVLIRSAFGVRAASARPLPRVLVGAQLAFVGAVAFWVAWGAFNGGSASVAYWQLRQLVYLPVLISLFAFAGVGSERHVEALGKAIVAAACVKVLVGAWFYFAIAMPAGLSPKYVTSHADTLLFATAVVLMGTRWLLDPSPRHLKQFALVAVWIGFGIFLNDRRIAYVAVAAGAAYVLTLTPPLAAKRLLRKAALVVAPLMALYVSAGWTSDAALFRPLHSIRTMFDAQEDSSTESRVIENRNLARSLADNPWLGAGFGREYSEYELGPDIGGQFVLYKSIPHNSVLALLWETGPLGFALLLSLFAAAAFVAARAFRFAKTMMEQTACLGAGAVVLLYMLQAWGDMGTQNWAGTFLVAAGAVVAARIGQRYGAFAARVEGAR